MAERSQGAGKAWAEPHTCRSAGELRRRLERMGHIRRAEYPGCGGRSRPEAHPGLAHRGRPSSAGRERRHGDPAAAREYLAGFAVPRKVRPGGNVSAYGRDLRVGQRCAGRVVYLQYDPDAREWVGTDEQDRQLRRWPAPEISRRRIVTLSVCPRR